MFSRGSREGTKAQGGVASLDHDSKAGGTLTYASCEYNGIYGRVRSEWRKENGKIIYSITVPSNVTVKALLPDGEHILRSGTYEINFEA